MNNALEKCQIPRISVHYAPKHAGILGMFVHKAHKNAIIPRISVHCAPKNAGISVHNALKNVNFCALCT